MLPLMRFRIKDKSMEPSFRDGDYVIVLPYFLGKPKEGDAVVLKHPSTGLLIIKRISSVKGDEYLVKCDNEKAGEDSRKFGAVKRISFLGRVVFHVKR